MIFDVKKCKIKSRRNTNKTETESHVAVDSTTAKMQAGSRTLVDLSETSPGVISMKVQAGDGSGSPASVEGMRIEGTAPSRMQL